MVLHVCVCVCGGGGGGGGGGSDFFSIGKESKPDFFLGGEGAREGGGVSV